MALALPVLAIVLVAVSLALSLAHALERPGKLRLSKDAYLTTQSIYYPGFTIGGIAEPAAIVATLARLLVTPFGSARFGLTIVALSALVMAHGLYWALIHPVNKVWLEDQKLDGAGGAFFATGDRERGDSARGDRPRLARENWTVTGGNIPMSHGQGLRSRA